LYIALEIVQLPHYTALFWHYNEKVGVFIGIALFCDETLHFLMVYGIVKDSSYFSFCRLEI
jgi:hypothetical protein